jgi:signal transduction histidine kinase
MVTGLGQLGEVVEDLLLSAQLRQLRRPFGPVDLAALAEELCVAEAARAEERGVTIEVRRGAGDHVVRGGTITADGRPGAGAVFTVRLPAHPTVRAEAPHRPAHADDHVAHSAPRYRKPS